jgi:hypothetical protein
MCMIVSNVPMIPIDRRVNCANKLWLERTGMEANRDDSRLRVVCGVDCAGRLKVSVTD